MNIVVIGHPEGFLGSQSMPRMAHYIASGFRDRKHTVQIWAAKGVRPGSGAQLGWNKWRGYFDQFVGFSWWMRRAVKAQPVDTVYFFVDQALAPWVLWVRRRPHVVLVSDMLAIRSAHGEFAQNKVRPTGVMYQRLILAGLRQAKQFIAVSQNTASDIQRLVKPAVERLHVVYNGLNFPFVPMGPEHWRRCVQQDLSVPVPSSGFLLHVGGSQWYKNRSGVLALYSAYVHSQPDTPHLWIVGAAPSQRDLEIAESIRGAGGQVRFWTGLGNDSLNALYSGASLMLFPSLAEGFGWPIAEAMACGCLVLTSYAAPMTEVGGEPAFYVPVMPAEPAEAKAWATLGAQVIHEAITLSAEQRAERVAAGFRQVAQFATDRAIEQYVAVCERVRHECARS